MTKRRDGYHNAFLQLPQAVWEALSRDAEGREESAARVLAEILRRHYKLPTSVIPKRKKSGRKPKK